MIEKKAVESNSYPAAWEKRKILDNGTAVLFRPIVPEDERLYQQFMQKSTMEDIRHRFLSYMKEIPHDLLFQFTHVDYNKAMAFIAVDEKSGDLLGVSRYAADPKNPRAEYAVMTRSDMKGHGIGFSLMQMLIDYAKSREVPELYGQIMRDSPEMIKMCKELGFQVVSDETDRCYLMTTLFLADKKKASV
jgi:acetyltransferase